MILDTLVIGGGPGGLLAAMYMARFRRSVLVVDAGSSRAHRIPRSHNYPGIASGVSGAELMASLREQLERYQVRTVVASIDALQHTHGHFEARGAQSTIEARTVILATGVQDVEPEIPHLAEALRDGAIRYCPVCDAFEVIGQRVGVLVSGSAGVAEAVCLRRYSEQVTVVPVDDTVRLSDDDRARMASTGIAVSPGPLRSLRVWDGRVTIEHDEQTTVCDTVYCALGLSVKSALASALGAVVDGAGYLQTDPHQQTSVPGLYAIGDVASGLNQISVAYGAAAIAAAAINVALSRDATGGTREVRHSAVDDRS